MSSPTELTAVVNEHAVTAAVDSTQQNSSLRRHTDFTIHDGHLSNETYLVSVFTPSGHFSSSMTIVSTSDQAYDLVLGLDWINSIQPVFWEGVLLDPFMDQRFPTGHSWISQFTDVATYNKLLAFQLTRSVHCDNHAASGESSCCNAASGESSHTIHAVSGENNAASGESSHIHHAIFGDAATVPAADNGFHCDSSGSMLCYLFSSIFGDSGIIKGDSFDRPTLLRLSAEHSVDLPHSSLYACTGALCDHILTAGCLTSNGSMCRHTASFFDTVDDMLVSLVSYITALHDVNPLTGYCRTLIRQVLYRLQKQLSLSLHCRNLVNNLLTRLTNRAMPSMSLAFFGLDNLSSDALQALGAEHNLFFTDKLSRCTMRYIIMKHVLHGDCFGSRSSHCSSYVDEFARQSSNVSFIAWTQSLVCKRLTNPQLQMTLKILNISSPCNVCPKHARRLLRLYFHRQKIQLRTDSSTRAAESTSRTAETTSRATDSTSCAAEFHSRCKRWPLSVPEDVKEKSVRDFQSMTSSDVLRRGACASCAESVLLSSLHTQPISSINLHLLKCHERINHIPFTTLPGIPDNILLCPQGVIHRCGEPYLQLCDECLAALRRNTMPPLAIANGMLLGAKPAELCDLTVVEESLIGLSRAKSIIFQLHQSSSESTLRSSSAINSQRAFRGHIVVHPQEPTKLLSILPPPPQDAFTPICVIFVGPNPPSRQWLREHARPLIVRRERVYRALTWLKTHNPLYENVIIDHSSLAALPDNDVPILPIQHLLPTFAMDSSTARHDNINDDFASPDSQTSPEIIFDRVVVSDVDGHAPAHVLRAAALRHFKEKQGAFLQMPHGPSPVPEFNNPAFFPSLYPTLFPYGHGGFEDRERKTFISLERQVKHFLNLYDRRFQTHYSFLFVVFNILQRRAILTHSSLKVHRDSFVDVAQNLSSIPLELVASVCDRVERLGYFVPENEIERRILRLLDEVKLVTRHVSGSSASKAAFRNQIRSMIIRYGLPAFFITINPADVYNPLIRFLAGEEIDLDNLLPENCSSYFEQSKLVAENPAVAAEFFDIYIKAFIKTLLRYNPDADIPEESVLGYVKSYFGCVEAQGRGSLHLHALIWTHGTLHPEDLVAKLRNDPDYVKQFLNFADEVISNDIPVSASGDINQRRSDSRYIPDVHCCATRGVPTDDPLYDYDVKRLVEECQTHRHTPSCLRLIRKGEPKECRFGLSPENIIPTSTYDVDSNHLTLRHRNGMVNNYNMTILRGVRSNMDIKCIVSSSDAVNITRYTTDYITKPQLRAHVAFAAVQTALKRVTDSASMEDDTFTFAHRLVRTTAFQMIAQHEMSAQQVMAYLRGFPDHYTNEQFRALYWPSYERVLEHQMPINIDQCDDVNVSDDTDEQQYNQIDNIDIYGDTNDILLSSSAEGDILPLGSQIQDYIFRPEELSSLSLWDFVSCTIKVAVSMDDSEPSFFDRNNSPLSINDIIGDTSYRRPKFRFKTSHIEYDRKQIQLLHPKQRKIPVILGSSLPRHDRDDCSERYARSMLLLFKPWRLAVDLRIPSMSWNDCLQAFKQNCSPDVTSLIRNCTLLHRTEIGEQMSLNRNRHHIRHDDAMHVSFDVAIDDPEELDLLQFRASLQHLISTGHMEIDNLNIFHNSSDRSQPIESELETNTEYIDSSTRGFNNLEILWKSCYTDRIQEWRESIRQVNVHVHSDAISLPQPQLSTIDHAHSLADHAQPMLVDGVLTESIQNTDTSDLINTIARTWKLNEQQNKAFRLVTDHAVMQQNTMPLRLFLNGPGGTGKSQVIKALKQFFEQRNESQRLRLSAYTGVAAHNIGGVTLHSVLAIDRRNQFHGVGAATFEDQAAAWHSVEYLFIDEVSMISCSLLTDINASLCDAKGCVQPFGGISIIFAGDFAQLPPVNGMRLYSRNPTISNENISIQTQKNIDGLLLWHSLTHVIILTENMRQERTSNNVFGEMLSRIREGRATEYDCNLLHSRVIQNEELDLGTPIIVSNNNLKDSLNIKAVAQYALESGQRVHWYHAVDKYKGKIITENEILAVLQDLHSGITAQRMTAIPLVIGMKVVVCQNFDVAHGIVNGSTGTVCRIRYTTDETGRRLLLSCIVKLNTASGQCMPHLQNQEFPILSDTVSFKIRNPHSGRSWTIRRTQLPIQPAYALTAHKAQGLTFESAIVDLTHCRGSEAPYVMISRVKTLHGLRILRPFPYAKLQCRWSEDLRHEMDRLQSLTTTEFSSR